MQETKEITTEYGASDIVYVITEDEGRVREHQLVKELNKINAVDSVVAISEQVDLAIPEPLIPDEVIDEFTGALPLLPCFLNLMMSRQFSQPSMSPKTPAACMSAFVTGPQR